MATKMSSVEEAMSVLDALPDAISTLGRAGDSAEIAAIVEQAEEALETLKNSVTLNSPASRRIPALNGHSR